MKLPLLFLFFILGCSCAPVSGEKTSVPSAQRSTQKPRKLSNQEAKYWIAGHLGVRYGTFISRGGKFHGLDSDGELSFISPTEIKVTEYGYAPTTYTGTYAIAEEGTIHVRLDNYPASWPPMHLISRGPKTMLMPVTGNAAFDLGGRAGGVEIHDMEQYWPFVHVYSKD